MNLVCLRENKAKCVGVLERKNGVDEFFFLEFWTFGRMKLESFIFFYCW